MSFLSVDVNQMEGMSSILVVVKPVGASGDWVLAEIGDREQRVHVMEKSTMRESTPLL